jgi:uncharacterized protein YkwD
MLCVACSAFAKATSASFPISYSHPSSLAPNLLLTISRANDAATVAATCSFEHSGGPHGENLFAGTTLTDQQAIDGWYSEGEQYDYNNPGFNENTGHFTQVVWKDSTRLGCARKDCGGDLGFFIVCEYEPRGNIVGNNGQYFRDNVLPA